MITSLFKAISYAYYFSKAIDCASEQDYVNAKIKINRAERYMNTDFADFYLLKALIYFCSGETEIAQFQLQHAVILIIRSKRLNPNEKGYLLSYAQKLGHVLGVDDIENRFEYDPKKVPNHLVRNFPVC